MLSLCCHLDRFTAATKSFSIRDLWRLRQVLLLSALGQRCYFSNSSTIILLNAVSNVKFLRQCHGWCDSLVQYLSIYLESRLGAFVWTFLTSVIPPKGLKLWTNIKKKKWFNALYSPAVVSYVEVHVPVSVYDLLITVSPCGWKRYALQRKQKVIIVEFEIALKKSHSLEPAVLSKLHL